MEEEQTLIPRVGLAFWGLGAAVLPSPFGQVLVG